MRPFRRTPAGTEGTGAVDRLLGDRLLGDRLPDDRLLGDRPVGGTGAPLPRAGDRPPVAAPARDAAPGRAAVDERLDRLAGGVDGSRRRRGTARDVRKVMHLIGMVAIGCGIAAVILGWYGASHSPYLYQEVPYLISGGLLGLALVFAGTAVYLGSWALRQVQESHRDTQAVVRSVERLERALRASAAVPLDRRDADRRRDPVGR
ncbi:MAG TPA: hypothetical protein VHB02_15990 [Acidimicrobiales bacterium]|nr:hypothetical protein [Acidimicrobiales bacterium]